MRTWWQQLQTRERNMLHLGGIVVALLLGWAFVWHPLSRARAELMQSVVEQQQAVVVMRAQAIEVQQLRNQGVQGKVDRQGKSLLALADATARGAALAGALKRVEPVSEKTVRVSLELASFDALMTWLDGLAREFGVQAVDFSIDRADGVGLGEALAGLEMRLALVYAGTWIYGIVDAPKAAERANARARPQ